MTVVIVDYGMSNLGSLRRSFEECGAEVVVADDPAALQSSTHIVLPGVGAFADGMKNLHERGWVEALRTEVGQYGIPLLGICLGMQLLAEKGVEGGETEGLGFIKGTVVKIQSSKKERVPHIGWNEIYRSHGQPAILQGIPDGSDFYFAHSYCFNADDPQNIMAITPYAGGVTSVVTHNNICGTQFHPEKSQVSGFQVMKNFLKS